MAETIGLDIGSHSIKLVGLEMTSKGPLLTRVGIKEIPYGEDRGDPTFLSETIKALYRKANLNPGEVKLTLSGAGVHIKRITLPSMPKAELKEAVRREMKNHLPYPIESAQIDFHVFEEFVDGDLKKLDMIALACPNSYIDRALSLADGAGLKPLHFNANPFALWNALMTFGSIGKDEVIALIDLGAEKTRIYLFKGGVLQFSREVSPAGADMTRSMMKGIDSDETPDFIYEQAEGIKKTMGIPSKDFYKRNGDQLVNSSKIPFLVRPVLERLIAEINRSFDYYKNQFRVDRIDRLLMAGGGANLKNLSSYLSEELRVAVERFNPLKQMLFDANKIDPYLLDQTGPTFAIAAGTALPERNRTELLPAKEPIFLKARIEKYLPRALLLITLFIFALIAWERSGEISRVQKERDEKIAKVKAIETLQAKLKLQKEKETHIKQDLSIFPPSMITPVPFRKVMGMVSHVVPKNVTATFLSVHSKAKSQQEESQSPEGNELRIKGLAFGSDLDCLTALARIIEGLEKSPLLENVRLISADENRSYNQPGVGFEILCDVEADHPPSFPFSKRGSEGFGEERQ